MTRPGLVDAEDLIRWADSFNARADLPRLIRRLIMETGREVVSLGFRAGAGVSLGGWDGTARSIRATPHIPNGLSLWEISTEQKVKQKADKDYKNRDSVTGSDSLADCTYIGVNMRRWGGREDWEAARNAEGKWRDVRFYDVDKVETWLEGAPVTHAWLSEHLGLTPYGLRAAEKWFEAWSAATDPPVPGTLVLAGRGEVADQLGERLSQQPQLITVRGSSLDDVLAFVGAVGSRLAGSDGGALLSRIAFVDQVEAWRRLEDHPTPLVRVPLGDDVVREAATGASRHHVIVPVVSSAVADIELPPVDSSAVAEILKEAGLDENKADEAGRLARFSILALRRRLALKPELHRPPWSSAPVPKIVRRLLLAAGWNESLEGDKQIVGTLLGGDYADFQDDLEGVSAAEDPIIGSVGSSTGLVSPYDAWLLLRETLRVEDLEALAVAVRRVLLEPNPVYDLETGERWTASIHGKVRDYSGDLRHGLASTLGLLGELGDRVEAGSGATGSDWAGYLVREILDAANADDSGKLWASLEDVLPLLAEAAPGRFLDAVRDGTQGDSPVLREVFIDEGDGGVFAAHSPHAGLLWALETSAWSPEHFGQAVDLLARLAQLDPGGHLSNRPFNSLNQILSPWHPQNSVDVARRLSAIDGLRKRHKGIAWRLLLSMLPEHFAIATPTHEPKYRLWKQEVAVTRPEYWAFIEEVVDRALEDVGDSADHWIELLEKFDDLPPPARLRVHERLAHTLASGALGSFAPRVWEQLRGLIAHHRRFSGADWALPADELEALESLARQFTPANPAREHGWLFEEQMPDLPEKHRGDDDWEHYQQRLAELRRGAVAAVDEHAGWDGIQALADQSKVPWAIGVALADNESPHEASILELLASQSVADVDLGMGYATRRFEQKSWEWLNPLIGGELSATQKARLLLATRSFPDAWDRADQLGSDVPDEFWRGFVPYGLGQEFKWAPYAAERLIAVRRNKAALELLNLYLRREQSVEVAELIVTGLENLLEQEVPDVGRLDRHDILQLFEFLQSSDLPWQRVARLEWSYASALDYEGRLTTLHRLMSEDPAFFAELISRVFRASDEPRDDAEVPEETARIATNAYRVLSHWKTPPGLSSEGVIDGDVLNAWVDAARELLAAAGRLDIGDVYIGYVLAHSPPDEDGVWPGQAVRALLETQQNDKIEEGLGTEIHNQRGVTTRGLAEGGAQERDLVGRYREEAARLGDEWPRSAAILRDIAEDYEREARRSDEDAERFRRGFER